jgi:hypothetical protein
MAVGWHGPGWYSLVFTDEKATRAMPFYFAEQVEYETALALGDRCVLIGQPMKEPDE